MITFVQMPTLDYDWMKQRPQHIMNKLNQRNHFVYYIEKNEGSHFVQKEQNLYVMGARYNINSIQFSGPVVLWCSSPEAILNIDKIPHDYVVYDVVDEAANELIGWRKYVDKMTEAADLVFTSSSVLYDNMRKKHTKVYLVNNGVDMDTFSVLRKEYPKDLPKNKKIIGYVGAIAGWMDFDIIKSIVTEANYNFVFVGPFLKGVRPNIIRSNVYFLGIKEYTALPYYINNFDCCIIPFKVNELSNACNPIKLYEYLSLGKPVVCTNMKEMIHFNTVCYISNSKEEFKENINRAVNEKGKCLPLSRMKIGRENSWDARVDTILSILHKEFGIQ